MSQISVLVWTVFSVTKRLLVLVMYFTPSLGLFSLLHHWQAESLPFAVSQGRVQKFLLNRLVE